MDFVVGFGRSKGAGEKGYRVKLVINDDRKDCSKSVVGGISFNHKLVVRKPMMEDRSTGESLFQCLESGAAFVVKVPVKGRIGRETGVGGSEESRSWVNGIHGRG